MITRGTTISGNLHMTSSGGPLFVSNLLADDNFALIVMPKVACLIQFSLCTLRSCNLQHPSPLFPRPCNHSELCSAVWAASTSHMGTGWWFGTFLFFHILGIIIPTDFHIFQRGRYTTNQYGNLTGCMRPPCFQAPLLARERGGSDDHSTLARVAQLQNATVGNHWSFRADLIRAGVCLRIHTDHGKQRRYVSQNCKTCVISRFTCPNKNWFLLDLVDHRLLMIWLPGHRWAGKYVCVYDHNLDTL